VGYAGGSKENPTYHSLGGHSETVEIDYDPSRISYAELLDIFWRSHNPTSAPYSTQYKSAIFYHDEEQKRLAEESKADEEQKRSRIIQTEIIPFTRFYLAEDYHQKYYLRARPDLANELHAVYPDLTDYVNSTAVARLNGYIGGNGDRETLQRELDSYGLSSQGKQRLLDLVGSLAR
jgi:methionine-S-sulfoxide reductase